MADDVEQVVAIRQLQGLGALFSCLPRDGKASEFLSLALGVNEGRPLDKIERPATPDDPDGIREWLESLWSGDDLAAEEQRLVDWQKDPRNVEAAVGELLAIGKKIADA